MSSRLWLAEAERICLLLPLGTGDRGKGRCGGGSDTLETGLDPRISSEPSSAHLAVRREGPRVAKQRQQALISLISPSSLWLESC